jgi:hypothetical protein
LIELVPGQEEWDPGATTVRLGLQRRRIRLDGIFLPAGAPSLRRRAPWLAPRVEPPGVRDPAVGPWTFTRLAAADFIRRSGVGGGSPPAPVAFLPPPETSPGPGTPRAEDGLDFGDGFSDLGVRVLTRTELGGDWVRFRPCTDQFQESCQPSLVPQLRPDVNFAVGIQGTVLNRIQVDVDYDRLREFGGVNTLALRYLGSNDDIIQRIDVGDVTFRLPGSRFLTEGVPAGNFGFQLQGQLGPVDFRGVWAEQRGDVSFREFRLTGVGQDRRFVQSDTLVLDDADFAEGQFFFIVDPEQIPGHPHLDVQALDAGSAPADVVPGIEPVQVYRFDANPQARQQVEGYIQADAEAEKDGGRVLEAGWFRALAPGQEYFIHPSGLWLALRTPLSRDEMLAVTYITAAGDTIGDYDPERIYTAGDRPQLRLLKATDANHQPGRPTWDQEMRQIYRVSTSPDVETSSVRVTVSLGPLSAGRTFKQDLAGRDITFLQLFGLDAESPQDVVDPAYIYTPGTELFQDPPVVPGTFLVFPTLQPFLRPPPLPAFGLTEEEALAVLGEDANERIYTAEDPFDRRNGGLFRITIPFTVRSEGVISTFSLGALGVLEGSERISLGDRLLIRGVEYEIDYDAGFVTLLDPEGLFATSSADAVRASWEQKQVFRTAPTQVLAFNAHTGDQGRGQLDLVALYQTEQTLVTRPVLGLEPGAVALTGLSGGLRRGLNWMDGFLGRLPGVRPGAASSFEVDGEVALSFPTPNTQGAVFLDDFDASDARTLSLLAGDWTRGSAPSSRTGAEDILPPEVGPSDLADITWQHNWILAAPNGDSVGIHEGFLPKEEIDQQIRVAGTQIREAGLRMILDDIPVGAQRWASITTTLSPNGTDLTRSEFLEFYVAGGETANLIVDLGTVSEDALFVDDAGNTSGVKPNAVPWGLDVLDQEADPARGQVWGNTLDEVGLWSESCVGEPGRVWRLGDPRANCTRSNGRNDSEDLDGDGNLDTFERSLRYVVELSSLSPFLARGRNETGTNFRLYRIPIRGGGVEVNGPVTEADLRAIRHIRLTVATARPTDLTVARMRIVGSRWIRRTGEGVLNGIIGDTAAMVGRAEAAPVSILTDGDDYVSPPGVLEELSDPTGAVSGQGLEFNERSLSIRVEDLQPGDRGEVFTRFPQRPRNFLIYRRARLWVVPRSGDWGPDVPVRFFFKIGTDPENFYLYRTPLRMPASGGLAQSDWLPEVLVDFERFLELRARAEETLITRPPQTGDPPVVEWSRDSTYAVVLRDRGRAPDLANVRELSLGIWNEGPVPFDGEVWVNELRLDEGDRDPGFAGRAVARISAGDVIQGDVSFSTRSGTFRQLRETATYQSDRRINASVTARLDRVLPGDWGIALPLQFSTDRSDLAPTFLTNSDVRADQIENLRDIGTTQSRVSLGFRKVTPSANPIVGALLDGLEGSASTYRVRNSAITTRVESRGADGRLNYARRLEPREFDPIPGFAEPFLRALLPSGLEEAVLNSRVRWSPERFGVGTSYRRRDDDIFRFERITAGPLDSLIVARRAPREQLEFAADLTLQPLGSLLAGVSFRSTRDLLDPEEAVTNPEVQALMAAERASLAGLDVGWETARTVTSRIRFDPRIWSWLTHEITWGTRYSTQRNPTFVGVVEEEGDSSLVLQRNVRGERNTQGRVSLDPGRAQQVAGNAMPGPFRAFFSVLRPVTYTFQDGVTSRFNRAAVDPGLGYQFGWVSLEGFRFLQQDTAATLTDGLSQRLAFGVGGPRATLDVAWSGSDVTALDARSDREITSRTWPEIRGQVADLTALSVLSAALQRVSLSASFIRNVRETRLGAGVQTRRNRELQLPWDLTLTWTGAVVTSYRGSLLTGDGEDPTGDTERDRVNHRLSVSSQFVPPLGIATGLSGPVRLSFIGSYGAERECRVPRARTECVPFIDQINRALSLALDTRVQDVMVGLQASFTDRRSYIGRRTGSTQFQLSVFGQFLFEAGRSLGPVGFPGM